MKDVRIDLCIYVQVDDEGGKTTEQMVEEAEKKLSKVLLEHDLDYSIFEERVLE